jgi:uncharacterized small protein (DUF1192 family)
MTRRERKENRLQRRLDWAAGREAKATAKFDAVHRLADSIPLGQPILVGHHSERHARKDQERIHNGMAAGIASQDMAAHHRSVAGGIERQLDRSIFSDDTDAVSALEARIAQLEEERERMKRANAAIRKGPGWEARLAAAGQVLTPEEVAQLASVARHQSYYCDKKTGAPLFPPYALSNLGGRISTDRKRLEHIKAQQQRAEQATAAGGLLVEYHEGQRFERFDTPTPEGMHGRHVPDPRMYISLTFEDKPAREILTALKAAGFYWGAGRWTGETAKLPPGILPEVQP